MYKNAGLMKGDNTHAVVSLVWLVINIKGSGYSGGPAIATRAMELQMRGEEIEWREIGCGLLRDVAPDGNSESETEPSY